MGRQWYFRRDGRNFGPVSGPVLRQLALAGLIAPTDLVRKHGVRRWSFAQAVQNLFTADPQPAPAAAAAGPAGPPVAPVIAPPDPALSDRAPAGTTGLSAESSDDGGSVDNVGVPTPGRAAEAAPPPARPRQAAAGATSPAPHSEPAAGRSRAASPAGQVAERGKPSAAPARRPDEPVIVPPALDDEMLYRPRSSGILPLSGPLYVPLPPPVGDQPSDPADAHLR